MPLKNCPLCGSDELTGPETNRVEANGYNAYIGCESCETMLELMYLEPTADDAATLIEEKWNTRPGE